MKTLFQEILYSSQHTNGGFNVEDHPKFPLTQLEQWGVCKSLVGVFPVGFPLVGVEDGTESGLSIDPFAFPLRSGLFEPRSDQVFASRSDASGHQRA